MGRVLIGLAIGMNILAAQAVKPDESTLPSSLQQALARIAKDGLLPPPVHALAPANVSMGHACSVPLLEVPLPHAEQFTIRKMPAHSADPMPRTTGPAPPCDSTSAGLVSIPPNR